MAVGFPDGPSYSGNSPHLVIFSPCYTLNDNGRAAFSFSKIEGMFLLSCFFFARFYILLLISDNIHPNPAQSFPV